MKSRTQIELFPRNRYLGAATAKRYFPRERERIAKLLGRATKVSVHFRVYDRATGCVLDFEVTQGALGDELPAEAARSFTLTPLSQNPSLPWNATNMPNMPDDGTWYLSPNLMLLDICALVSGGANLWVEFEGWAVAEFDT